MLRIALILLAIVPCLMCSQLAFGSGDKGQTRRGFLFFAGRLAAAVTVAPNVISQVAAPEVASTHIPVKGITLYLTMNPPLPGTSYLYEASKNPGTLPSPIGNHIPRELLPKLLELNPHWTSQMLNLDVDSRPLQRNWNLFSVSDSQGRALRGFARQIGQRGFDILTRMIGDGQKEIGRREIDAAVGGRVTSCKTALNENAPTSPKEILLVTDGGKDL